MSSSDSVFVLEILLEELYSCVKSQEFYVKCQFGDLFDIHLKDPNEDKKPKKKKPKKKFREPLKEKIKPPKDKKTTDADQSITFTSSVKSLIDKMQEFPLQLTVWDKDNPYYKVGSFKVPWSCNFYKYLQSLYFESNPPPVSVVNGYNVFDEDTARHVAVLSLNIKLTCLRDNFVSTIRPVSAENLKCFKRLGFHVKANEMCKIYSDTEEYKPIDIEDPGVIKTTYSGGKRKKTLGKSKSKDRTFLTPKAEDETESIVISEKIDHDKDNVKKFENLDDIHENIKDSVLMMDGRLENIDGSIQNLNENFHNTDKYDKKVHKINSSILSFVKSDTDLDKRKQPDLRKSKSCCLIEERYNMFKFISGNNRPFINNVYWVNYFTVHSSVQSPSQSPSDEESDQRRGSFKFRVCASDCPSKSADTCSDCKTDLPAELAESIIVTKCRQIDCQNKKFNEPPTPPDNRIMIRMPDKIEEITGGMKANMEISEDNCFCTCECTFGFVKKTTFCKICGGYEKSGEDLDRKPPGLPFPCPVYHKLVIDKTKKQESKEPKTEKKNKKIDDRFKFNYGYKGIPPQIGHARCAPSCMGGLFNVPKQMGWLWTADDVPGLKFRPSWKPGAANKHVVRMLKIAKNPNEAMKKRKRDTGKKKRPLKRPLLVVHKEEGEYTITMETMKTYNKIRHLNQHPYEDKPVLTYTIGRTDEENKVRRKKKEREQRRLERCQREFIQSAFRDMCREICLKTYQQALGILPGAEDPECMCCPGEPGPDRVNVDHSCSCSEDKSYISTDTDSDEWILEFTPPIALYDPTFKGKKTCKLDNTCQYNYLDFRVNLIDAHGNPVPRFFKGPDGTTQCSDLGGFWDPNHQWLEINVDGYVGVDGRWAPMSFIGPDGEKIDCENGKFQAADGKWLMVGIDGFIDSQGKWVFYCPQAKVKDASRRAVKRGTEKKKKNLPDHYEPSLTGWSCFGDTTPHVLSKMGIVGHGHDKKLLESTLTNLRARGVDVKITEPTTVPRLGSAKSRKKQRMQSPDYFIDGQKCKHPVPSEKGIVAVDGHGHKTYFKLKDYKNKRPKERMTNLTKHGISVSSFHVPCFHSFINSEIMKQELLNKRRRRLLGDEELAGMAGTASPPRGPNPTGPYPTGPAC